MIRKIAVLMLIGALSVACVAPRSTSTPGATLTLVAPTATRKPLPPTATPTPTATPGPLRVWFEPAVPDALRSLALMALSARQAALSRSAAGADLKVGLGHPIPIARWAYAVVAPFPTLADEVHWTDVRAFWAGKTGALAEIGDGKKTPTLFVTADVLSMLRGLLGEPNAQAPISVTATADLVDSAWAARPAAWSIVPFDELQPRWKALRVDGLSVLDKALDMDRYPLSVSMGALGGESQTLAAALVKDGEAITNHDPARMTVLVMTGVTALVRGTADRMEKKGVLYPGELIGPLLREADITHISNEISFAANCPPPDPHSQSLAFCSDPKYMDLLRAVGADVIELTGNHVKDYGSQPMLDTLDIYDRENLPYFGGGRNLEDARKPLIVERNGVQFGFIGCNPVGPPNDWATEDRPGAAPCDCSDSGQCEYEYVRAELAKLKAQVDVPIATLQYWEFSQYEPTPQQRVDFCALVDAGAVIVSGSQAHQPQGFEFYKGAFIHYGLGNLFFDQMWSLPTRQEIVDRHVIYQGRHISTELYTYLLEDYAQPRPMTPEERRELLKAVFKASGW